MLLDSCISVDTWITFNFECKWRIWYLMGHRDLTNDTMCSLRYINKVADIAAGCHLILHHSWSLLMQHSLKRKNALRKGLPLGRKKCTWRLNTALKVKKHTLFFRWFLDKHMRLEHLFDIHAKVLMPAHHLEFYIRFLIYVLVTCLALSCVVCGILAAASLSINAFVCPTVYLTARLSQP